MDIRRALADDALGVATVHVRSWQAAYRGLMPDVYLDPLVVGELAAIYLLPQVWGSGVGRRLMLAAVNVLRDAGFAEAILWVLEGNERAQRFYEIGGWQVDGVPKDVVIADVNLAEVRYRLTL